MRPAILLLLAAALAPAGATCLPVSGERILAGDMARAVPAFAQIAPGLVLGFAPVPGGRRTYDAPELARLARRYGLEVSPGVEACFVRPRITLTREAVFAALQSAMPATRIDVLDFSHQPIPPGELHFPVSGLVTEPLSRSPLLWRGAVRAPGQADFPVWARVRVQVSGKQVIAAQPLAPGRPIQADQLQEVPYQGPPGLPNLSQVVGRVPRRLIPAGSVVEAQWLEVPPDVARGERVRVEVLCGLAHLRFVAQAQASGWRGQVIAVRNPSSGRIFRAMVAGHGRVTLAVDGAIPAGGDE